MYSLVFWHFVVISINRRIFKSRSDKLQYTWTRAIWVEKSNNKSTNANDVKALDWYRVQAVIGIDLNVSVIFFYQIFLFFFFFFLIEITSRNNGRIDCDRLAARCIRLRALYASQPWRLSHARVYYTYCPIRKFDPDAYDRFHMQLWNSFFNVVAQSCSCSRLNATFIRVE